MSKLTINIISQEKKILEIEADSLTATTTEGEITVLPGHLPLFSKLGSGELIYRNDKTQEIFAVSQGFIDVGPNNKITIIADSLTSARDLNPAKVQEAIKQAQENLIKAKETNISPEEIIKIEAALKQAFLEEKIASKTSKSKL